jgi:membrane-associated protease RseP (regulator of RpoE activity)
LAAPRIVWHLSPVTRRPVLHVGLFAATVLTLLASGGAFWESAEGSRSIAAFLGAGLPYAAWVVAILGAHEMGHYVACRLYRIPATLPFFIPGLPPVGTFGAVIRIRGRIPSRRALFDVAAAGPLAGFAVAVVALALGLLRSEPFPPDELVGGATVWQFGKPAIYSLLRDVLTDHAAPIRMNALCGAGWIGMLVTSLNLFPVGQLDGGHAAYAISRRLHRWLSRAVLAGLLGVILHQALGGEFPAYAVWFGVLLWMRDRHPPVADEQTPLGAGRLLVGFVLLVLFAVTFALTPIRVVEIAADPPAEIVLDQDDVPVEIGATHSRTGQPQPSERLGMRMPERIAASGGGDGPRRADGLEELRARAEPAAVVRHDERLRAQARAARHELALAGGPEIAR